MHADIYDQRVPQMDKPESFKQDMMTLFHMGFTNFRTNRGLLEKYTDVNVVANHLLSGALNESAIDAVFRND